MIEDLKEINEKVFSTPLMQKALLIMLIMAIAALIFPSGKEPETEQAASPPEYGQASFYADYFEGRRTASGAAYRQNLFTAAHRTLPFGTKVRVTCMESTQSTEVTINDRGPFVKGRIIDLSKSAFNAINDKNKGIIFVKVEIIEANDNTSEESSD